MDELDYEVLVQEARDLVKRRDFKRLEIGVGWLLEQGHEIGPELCERVREITQQETKTVPASAKATADAGRFMAIGDVRDRSDTDRIAEGAFDRTIKRWQESGEQIPLLAGNAELPLPGRVGRPRHPPRQGWPGRAL